MSQSYGLGRGLSSLIPPKDEKKNNSSSDLVSGESDHNRNGQESETAEIELNRITANPHQPRSRFDEEKLKELADSIKNHGIIQPLVVSKSGANFELIAGERRLQASKIAGLNKVPIIIRNADEKEKLELAIIENIQRHNLNPIEEAKAYTKLVDEYEMNQDEVAKKMGKSRSAIANKTRLLKLPVEAQKAIISGEITEGHAKAILALSNAEKQRAMLELILRNNLTVRQTEDKTKDISIKAHKRKVTVDPETKRLEDELMETLGTKVKVKKSGGGGKIIIDYYSNEELNNVLSKISK